MLVALLCAAAAYDAGRLFAIVGELGSRLLFASKDGGTKLVEHCGTRARVCCAGLLVG